MARKSGGYYAVARGKQTGVFDNWSTCKENTSGYSNAKFKKFDTKSEAMAFVKSNQSGQGVLKPSSSGNSGSSYGGSSYGGGSSGYKSSRRIPTVRTVDSSPVFIPHITSVEPVPTEIYVDGACRNNGKGSTQAGYGVYVGDGDKRNAAVPLSKVDNVSQDKPTNQRAELHALDHGLSIALDSMKQGKNESFEIKTDSAYAKNCVESWSGKWRQNGWKNSLGETVANQDIIKSALNKYEEINTLSREKGLGKIIITHVKGHAGIHGNEMADRLANKGADEM